MYSLNAFCEVAVISRNLSASDPRRFPAAQYDLTAPANPGSQVIRNALHWFISLALPDRTMPTIGDSMAPRAGMSDYFATAEVGYRYFDLQAVGDYETLRNGQRSWGALLYGAPQIVSTPLPYTSSYLSSGWVSLRNEWQGNKVWIGLNALVPGGGHQHADRLSLLSYSHGKLLALEKATPYNENVTRELGTFSPSHNTVTVDQTSQKQGEALSGDEVPVVAYFFAPSVAKFAELPADQMQSSRPRIHRARRCVSAARAMNRFWQWEMPGSTNRICRPSHAVRAVYRGPLTPVVATLTRGRTAAVARVGQRLMAGDRAGSGWCCGASFRVAARESSSSIPIRTATHSWPSARTWSGTCWSRSRAMS